MVSNPYSGIGTAVVFAAIGGPIHGNIIQITTLYNVCSVHRGMFSTSGDTMSTSGGYHEYIGGGGQYIGGIP